MKNYYRNAYGERISPFEIENLASNPRFVHSDFTQKYIQKLNNIPQRIDDIRTEKKALEFKKQSTISAQALRKLDEDIAIEDDRLQRLVKKWGEEGQYAI